MRVTLIVAAFCAMLANPLFAQHDQERETDPLVLKKLAWWQDQKFGLLLHWGPYSQWGVVESWSLCPEDEPWCQRTGPFASSYPEYKKAYEALQTTFNPRKFDPRRWASLARSAGMRYVVFTTKHHDGFCMFDTKLTRYRVTDPVCPFSVDSRRNTALEIFDAFRAEHFGIGAYFSKPDWHSNDYWWSYFPPFDRNVNYDPARYPDRWEAFRKFTAGQIDELMSGYGPIDILWLDGGWVRPQNKHQDIDMPTVAAAARAHQPGLIIVDRSVGGRFENYRTPEQKIPDAPLDYPWETCMTMGDSWSFKPGDVPKPAAQLIHMLVDIVAKGGNFLLNIGPSPDGEFPPQMIARLNDIGAWMEMNGGAIYATRPIAPYRENRFRFTRAQSGTVNAIYLAEDSLRVMPGELALAAFVPKAGTVVRLRGADGPLAWHRADTGCVIQIPESVRRHPPCAYAWTFSFVVD